MTLSAKWSAVSFLAFTALGAASVAFAGCSVTSGTVNDKEGGTIISPGSDSGTDSATVNACPGNTKQTFIIQSKECQAAAEVECCTQLKNCFNIDPATTDGGTADDLDCNGFFDCTDKCNKGADADKVACQNLCNLGTPDSIEDAYDAILACVTAGTQTNKVCQ